LGAEGAVVLAGVTVLAGAAGAGVTRSSLAEVVGEAEEDTGVVDVGPEIVTDPSQPVVRSTTASAEGMSALRIVFFIML
jgi:hypothetical protein